MKHLAWLVLAFLGGLAGAQEVAIQRSAIIPAPVPEVWKAWTTRDGLRSFLCEDALVDLRLGGAYEIYFSSSAPAGTRGSDGCRVLSYAPEKMLSFTWNAPPSFPAMRNMRTFVVLMFEKESDASTRLTLRHAGWSGGTKDNDVRKYFEAAWDQVLSMCRERFEKGPRNTTAEPKPPVGRNDEPLKRMADFIGGTWKGEVKAQDGSPMVVEFRYRRHPDGVGIYGEGVIGKGRKDAVHVRNQFGWDPIGKAVYYFDSHNSGTLYFGWLGLEKDDLVFTFGPLGGAPSAFSSRGRFKDKDTYVNVIENAKGEQIEGFTLKRVKG